MGVDKRAIENLAIVGGGQMGRALAGGMLHSKLLAADQLQVVEPNTASQQWWAENHPQATIAELPVAVAASDTVLLAVKPQVIAKVAAQPAGFWDGKLVISIAAGVPLKSLCKWVGHQRVARVMPNTPSLVGAGASGFCCAVDVSDSDQAAIAAMLQSVGVAMAVDESLMDAVTGLSGSGPAYVCLMIEALADGGVLAGLPRAVAMQLATQTVLGTAQMIAKTGRHPGELKDAVTSPAGTTIAAISVLEQNGLRGALIQAVAAAADRSRQLGQS